MKKFLNQEVANFTLLYTKLHNYHWFVTGKGFFQLHAKFEELYDYVTEKLDEIAERLLQVDGKPVATLKEVLDLATLKEATGEENVDGMIQSVLNDFTQLNEEFTRGIKLAEEENDPVTVDLFTGIKADLEKHIWMLRAYLK